MPYRDDDEAIRERADALEVDVERLEDERARLTAERDRLAAELSAARARPPGAPVGEDTPLASTADDEAGHDRSSARPTAPSSASTPARWRGAVRWGLAVSAIGALVSAMIYVECRQARSHDRWRARRAARQHHVERWAVLVDLEPCVHEVAVTARVALRYQPERYDPRRDDHGDVGLGRLAGRCVDDARWLVADRATSDAVRTGLQRWLDDDAALAAPVAALGDYYRHRDWVEDDLAAAPRLWAAVGPGLAHRDQALRAVHAAVVPVLRDEVRALQRRHEAERGRDEVWWRIELALDLRALAERLDELAGLWGDEARSPTDAATAVRADAAALVAKARDAPLPLRRAMRDLDQLTGPLAAGVTPPTDAVATELLDGARRLLQPTRAQPPALPADPGPDPDR